MQNKDNWEMDSRTMNDKKKPRWMEIAKKQRGFEY